MIRGKSFLVTAALALTAVALAGCISLFPKTKPSQLYRFGGPSAEAAGPAAPAAARVGFLKPPATFSRAAAGDQLLSITGEQAAYIAEARWVAPASTLFDEAVSQAFDANVGPARLVTRGEIGKAAYTLRLDVRNFETVYDQGQGAAPQVLIRVRGTITRNTDRTVVSERIFERTVRAGDNRISAIVMAYDAGMSALTGELVAWANSAAAGG
jgi:cholesterol transport system auxiliary component